MTPLVYIFGGYTSNLINNDKVFFGMAFTFVAKNFSEPVWGTSVVFIKPTGAKHMEIKTMVGGVKNVWNSFWI